MVGLITQAVAASVVEVREPLVVDPEKVEERGVHVVHRHRIDGCFVADLIGLAVAHAPSNPGTRHPEEEA